VEAYCDEVGLKPPKPFAEWSSDLVRDHGNLADKFLAMSERRKFGDDEEEEESILAVKNADIRFSLDVASQYTGNQYREYLKWFLQQGFSPKRVLDVGCDNGLATCAYARFFPDSEVVGLDIEHASVNCGQQLARTLRLQNVRFVQGDLLAPVSTDVEAYDLVVASLVVYEALSAGQMAKNLASLVAPRHGRLVSFEPLRDSALDSWVEELRGAGLLVESQDHVRILTADDRPFDIAALVCRDRGQSLSAHGDDFESPIAQN
jgi:SAM-dependent methyltransferase